jgi:hypothetical protein
MIGTEVPDDDISWVTIIIDVCDPTPKALRQWAQQFLAWARLAAKGWGVGWFGRFEVDLLLDPPRNTSQLQAQDAAGTRLRRDARGPVVVFHVHLIVYHPKLKRALLAYHLKRCIAGTRRTQARPLSRDQAQTEALDHVTRYMVKSLPPEAALPADLRRRRDRPQAGSRYGQRRRPAMPPSRPSARLARAPCHSIAIRERPGGSKQRALKHSPDLPQ